MIPIIKNTTPTKKADWILVLLSHRTAQYLNKHLELGGGAFIQTPPLPALKQWLQSKSLAAQERNWVENFII